MFITQKEQLTLLKSKYEKKEEEEEDELSFDEYDTHLQNNLDNFEIPFGKSKIFEFL